MSDTLVPILNPQGDLVQIPQADLQRALAQGFAPPSPEQLAQIENMKRLSTPGQAVIAGAERAASALTFGLSAGLEQGLGVPAEDILGRKEANPVASGIGTVVGVAAPLLATAGGSAGAQAPGLLRGAAEITAPSLIARAGRAVAGALPEGAGVMGRVAPVVAQGAVEGALYAGSDVVEKLILGDPHLTAEKAAAEVGLGALFGGGLMGGGKLAQEGLGAIIGKTRDALETVAQKIAKGDEATVEFMFKHRGEIASFDQAVPGAANHVAQSTPQTAAFILKNQAQIAKLEEGFPGLTEVLSRAEPKTAQTILDNWGKLLKDPQARIEVGLAQGRALQETYSTVEGALRQSNRTARPAEIERLLGKAQGAPDDYLYHVTPTANEGAIAREGLRPDAPKIAEGGPHANTKAVFLADEETSGTYRSLYGEDETSVYRVAKNRLSDLAEDTKSEGAAFLTKKAIPPHALERLVDGEWVPVVSERAGAEYGRIFDAIDQLAGKMRAEPELYPAMYPKKLEQIRDAMVRDVGTLGSRAEIFKSLNGTKQLVDDLAKFGKNIPPEHVDAVNAIKGLRSEVKAALENPEVWGEAGERQAAYNAAQNQYFTAKKALEKALMQKVTTRTGAVTYEVAPTKVNSWINLMADARGQAKTQVFDDYLKAARNLADEMETSGLADAPAVRQVIDGAVEAATEVRQRASVTQLVKMLQGHEILSSGPAIPTPQQFARSAAEAAARQMIPGGVVSGITEGVAKLRSPAMMTGVLNALDRLAEKTSQAIGIGVGRIFEAEGARGAAGAAESVTKVTRENFPHVASTLGDLGSNADRMAEIAGQQTGPLQPHAPVASEALLALAARGLGHMGTKVPRGGPKLALDADYRPSDSELAALNRTIEIAEKPTRVLDHIARGSYTHEQHETLTAIYPRLAEEMKMQVLDHLAKERAMGRRLPNRVRLSLATFLGADLDSTMTPAAIASAQASYAMAPGAEAAAAGPKVDPSIRMDSFAAFSTGRQQSLGRLG